jgi:hypothetical protein
LYQHLIQNKNQKLLADWQNRYVTFYLAFAVYGNGLFFDIPFMEMVRPAYLPFMETASSNCLSVAK